MTASSRQLLQNAPALRRRLAAWFVRKQRPLPWRTQRSLYRTVVSEFMLQQTAVATVLPYFARWMQALPDFAALAAAEETTVVKLWEGLGYYRRARSLHALARALAGRAAPPRTAREWQELPGIGPYTAAAIASLAFEEPAACVDGNVVRILARLTADRRRFPDGSAAVKAFTPLAAALLDPRHPGRHNEAMMELGATVCGRRQPRCTACPLATDCDARRRGIAEELPRIQRTAPRKLQVDRIWWLRNGRLLLHRIPDDARRMRGLYELPSADQLEIQGDSLITRDLIATRRRTITHHQITERIFRLNGRTPVRAPRPGERHLQWIPLPQLDGITLSGPHRRWIRALLAES